MGETWMHKAAVENSDVGQVSSPINLVSGLVVWKFTGFFSNFGQIIEFGYISN